MGRGGLLLAIAGLYGLVATNVRRRTREIGYALPVSGKLTMMRLVMGKGLVLRSAWERFGLARGFAASSS